MGTKPTDKSRLLHELQIFPNINQRITRDPATILKTKWDNPYVENIPVELMHLLNSYTHLIHGSVYHPRMANVLTTEGRELLSERMDEYEPRAMVSIHNDTELRLFIESITDKSVCDVEVVKKIVGNKEVPLTYPHVFDALFTSTFFILIEEQHRIVIRPNIIAFRPADSGRPVQVTSETFAPKSILSACLANKARMLFSRHTHTEVLVHSIIAGLKQYMLVNESNPNTQKMLMELANDMLEDPKSPNNTISHIVNFINASSIHKVLPTRLTQAERTAYAARSPLTTDKQREVASRESYLSAYTTAHLQTELDGNMPHALLQRDVDILHTTTIAPDLLRWICIFVRAVTGKQLVLDLMDGQCIDALDFFTLKSDLASYCASVSTLFGCNDFYILEPHFDVFNVVKNNNGQYRTHCENDKAFGFKYGYDTESSYQLNGVTVPKWVVMTAAKDLKPADVIGIRNVEVRREAIKKMGIKRVTEDPKLTEVISEYQTYKLLGLRLDSANTRAVSHYLMMLNPSTGDTHLEGVPNHIRTVRDAILWRNGINGPDYTIDDKIGIDYYQQGDVVIVPSDGPRDNRGALILKAFPKVLT